MGTHLSITFHGSPADLREKLNTMSFQIRDLWFPTRGEMMGWQESEKPYFVRWLAPDRFEMGIRQETTAAARLAPQWFCEMVIQPEHTQILFRLGFPHFTRNLLWGFAMCQGVWGLFATESWRIVWLGTSGILLLTISIAWFWGRQSLKIDWARLREELGGSD